MVACMFGEVKLLMGFGLRPVGGSWPHIAILRVTASLEKKCMRMKGTRSELQGLQQFPKRGIPQITYFNSLEIQAKIQSRTQCLNPKPCHITEYSWVFSSKE